MKTFKKNYCKLLFAVLLLNPGVLTGQNLVAEGNDPEMVTEGFDFTEGPYWHPEGYLLFSNIPGNEILKWSPGSEEAELYMSPSGHSNGITANPQGELVLAQHDGMISKVDDDKNVVVLAQTYEDNRLNSPNDVVVSSDGIIYFTDPPFGVSEEDRELEYSGVYLLRENEEPQLQYQEFDRPNGLVLSPDEQKLYVNNTSDGRIVLFEVAESGELTNPQDFASVGASEESGAADGMTVDREGRVYTTGPGGLYIFSVEGEQVQKIELPARATNIGWGGDAYDELYITTPSAVYRLEMNTTGVAR